MARFVLYVQKMGSPVPKLLAVVILWVGMGGSAFAEAPAGATKVVDAETSANAATTGTYVDDDKLRHLSIDELRERARRVKSPKGKARIEAIIERRQRIKNKLKGEPVVAPVPELDPSAAGLAIFLLVGTSLILRERRAARV